MNTEETEAVFGADIYDILPRHESKGLTRLRQLAAILDYEKSLDNLYDENLPPKYDDYDDLGEQTPQYDTYSKNGTLKYGLGEESLSVDLDMQTSQVEMHSGDFNPIGLRSCNEDLTIQSNKGINVSFLVSLDTCRLVEERNPLSRKFDYPSHSQTTLARKKVPPDKLQLNPCGHGFSNGGGLMCTLSSTPPIPSPHHHPATSSPFSMSPASSTSHVANSNDKVSRVVISHVFTATFLKSS